MNNTVIDLGAVFGHAVLLPIPKGTKAPVFKGWGKMTYEDSQAPDYQARLAEAFQRANIGVLLGSASNYLVAIDWDTDELAEEFLRLNPAFHSTTCTKGERGCQFFIRMTPGTYPDSQAYYKLQTVDGARAGEFRCGAVGGAQSVIHGQHPHQMLYQFLNDAPPMLVDFDSIKWPLNVVLPWLKTETSTRPELAPIAVVDAEARFQRKILEQKIPLELPTGLLSVFCATLGKILHPYAFFERNRRCVELQFDYKLGVHQLAEADPGAFRTDVEAIVEPYAVTVNRHGEREEFYKSLAPLVRF